MATRDYSKVQENRVAKILGGKVVANSGATSFNKGDVILPQFLIECKTKTSESNSQSIKKEWLETNKKEAYAMGCDYSVLAIDFGSGDDYFVIDKVLMQRLVALVDEHG